MTSAYIVAASRTPVGKINGVFKNYRPDDLLADTIKATLSQVQNFSSNEIQDVIVGCAMPEAEQGMNVARISSLLAGLPNSTAGMTVNRFCASGAETIAIAAQKILSGQIKCAIAGGTESMTKIPMGGFNLKTNPRIFQDENINIAYGMGLTAEIVAKKYNISREDQDIFAYNSHQKALQAQKDNSFHEEICPITVETKYPDLLNGKTITKSAEILQDEGPRSDTTIEKIAKLKPVFKSNGGVSAASSSQMSDGAASLLLVNDELLKKYNLTPLAKFKSYAVAGVSPEVMGIGPVVAIPQALQQANLQLNDIDWIELNEAFAAQSLAVIKELSLDNKKVNPCGGAIALGHPLGATGAIRAVTAVYGARRANKKYSMVTMCIGTGMGAALILENLI